MIKLLYWAFVALDIAALLFFFALGLAAAGSSRTSPIMVALVMLVLPAIPLAGSIWLFLRSSALVWRAAAFVLAAAPLMIAVTVKAYSDAQIRANSNANGDLTFFREGPQRDLINAIRNNNAAAIATLATKANVNASGMDDMTPLVSALRQLRATPTQHEALRALLAAGADPNKGTAYELPLEMALQIDDKTGPTPVEMLLAAGANPNVKNSSGVPIFFAGAGNGASVETLASLLKHGADLHATSPKGETILFYAASAQNWKAAVFLLQQGADPAQGRSAKGLTFADMVDDIVREQKARDDYNGTKRGDDGVQDVVTFLRGR